MPQSLPCDDPPSKHARLWYTHVGPVHRVAVASASSYDTKMSITIFSPKLPTLPAARSPCDS